MTSNEEILSALLEGEVEGVKTMLVKNIVSENSSYMAWINHPEYLSVDDTNIYKKGDQLILTGTVYYRDSRKGEKVRVTL